MTEINWRSSIFNFIFYIGLTTVGFLLGWQVMNVSPVVDHCNDFIYEVYVEGAGCKDIPFEYNESYGIVESFDYALNDTRYEVTPTELDTEGLNIQKGEKLW